MPVAAHYLLESVESEERRLICVVPSLVLAMALGECRAGIPLEFAESLPGYWEATGPSQLYCIRLYPVEVPEAEPVHVGVLFEARMLDTR